MNRLPSLFISHGAPTFATEPGRAGALLAQLGRELPAPRAVVVLSPHWVTRELEVGFASAPETLHDFGGFPAELYTLRYPAPGHPGLASRVVELLAAAGWKAAPNPGRGLDHGVWVPLRHLFPEADVPVVPVSMPRSLDAAGALRLGRALAPLAAEGVLIAGSGSLTHNLREFFGQQAGVPEASYAREFVAWARGALRAGDGNTLVDYLAQAPHAARAHPSADHYLPLPFAWGAAAPGAPVRILDGGILHGMLSMESYVLGEMA